MNEQKLNQLRERIRDGQVPPIDPHAFDSTPKWVYQMVTEEQPDMVSHPPHYTSHPSGVEPITITRHESFCLGNVIKYCMRAKYKGNEIQDLRKAAQYLAWEIERLEGQS